MSDGPHNYVESHDRDRVRQSEVDDACLDGMQTFVSTLGKHIPEVEFGDFAPEQLEEFMKACQKLAGQGISNNSALAVGEALSKEQAQEVVNTAVDTFSDRATRDPETRGYEITVVGSEATIRIETIPFFRTEVEEGGQYFRGLYAVIYGAEEPSEGEFRGYVALISDSETGDVCTAFSDEEAGRFLAEFVANAEQRAGD